MKNKKINNMQKILIIGSCGAGKSTLAKKISDKLNLPLIGLDQNYWLPNWQRPLREDFRTKVKELVKNDKWIMEGNYQNTFDIRFPACDTIIFVDINRLICFYRIWKRLVLNNRTDKLDNCKEKMDFKLMKWVLWDYPRRGKRKIDKFIKEYSDKKIIVINSRKILNNLDKILYNK